MTEPSDRYSAQFKARVVLEALKATDADSSVAKAYGIHPVTLSRWKQQLTREASLIFGDSEALQQTQRALAELDQKNRELEREVKILREFANDASIDRKFQIVNDFRDEVGLNRILEIVQLPKSTYYYRLNEEGDHTP